MRVDGYSDSSADLSMSKINPGAANSRTTPQTGSVQTASGSPQNSDGAQLSKLSSVLNGLESGASAIRRHVQQAMGAVRAGTYEVDPLQLSKRIVGEALGPA